MFLFGRAVKRNRFQPRAIISRIAHLVGARARVENSLRWRSHSRFARHANIYRMHLQHVHAPYRHNVAAQSLVCKLVLEDGKCAERRELYFNTRCSISFLEKATNHPRGSLKAPKCCRYAKAAITSERIRSRNMSEVEDSRERSACTVKCKVSDMAQSQSTSFAARGNRCYPAEPDFCFFPLFLFLSRLCLSLRVRGRRWLLCNNEIAWKRRNPLPSLFRCFARFRNINYALPVKLHTCTARRRYRISHRSIISRGVLKYLRPCNLIKLCRRARGITLPSLESGSSVLASPGRR